MISVRYRHFLLLCVTVISSIALLAQQPPRVPTRWGVQLGLNYNMAGVGYGLWAAGDPLRPGAQFTKLVLNDGSGIGLYGGLSFQTALSNDLFFGARLSYDSRSLIARDDQTYTKPDGSFLSDEYSFKNSFISLEPHVKFYLGRRFHVTGGLGMGLVLNQTYDYTPEGGTPRTGLEVGPADTLKHSITWSGFAGLGYDLYLTDSSADQQLILTPFLETSYMVSQRGVDFTDQTSFDGALSTVSVRAGISLAIGNADHDRMMAMPTPKKYFRVMIPADGIYSRRVERAAFPLRAFVFFDRDETELPGRYNLITPDETATFGQNTGLTADDIANVQERTYIQREVYYHLLNIMGWRLKNYAGSSVELYASDPDGKDPMPYAESVKRYLVDTWGVDPSQLKLTTGPADPKSGTPRTPAVDVPFTHEENRRVQFRNYNPAKLGGPVYLSSPREAEEDHQVFVELTTNEDIASWSATITGNGMRRQFGPFKSRSEYLDPTGMLRPDQKSAQFTANIIATKTDGTTLSDAETFMLVRTDREGSSRRHRLLFNYAEEDPIGRSKALIETDIVPDIKAGSKVYVYGHTDSLGADQVNLQLSRSRANDVKKILQEAISARGISGVKIYAYGLGEDDSPFENEFPEGRMYNRTVIIDIVP